MLTLVEVPQVGALDIRTEFGCMLVRPGELCVVPRGIRFNVSLPQGNARGFVFETYSGHYELPELGPIGSYCLANARDFEIPKASIIESDEPTEVFTKFGGTVHRMEFRGSIFNVAAWHGTYYPFKYDLLRFSPIGSLLVDHPVGILQTYPPARLLIQVTGSLNVHCAHVCRKSAGTSSS